MQYLSLCMLAGAYFGGSVLALPSYNTPDLVLDWSPAFSDDTAQLSKRTTCSETSPCVSGACCSVYGYCGWSSAYCGSGNCTSQCDAELYCGPVVDLSCPLNVCCSAIGTCGTDTYACITECVSGYGSCGAVTTPSCSGTSASAHTVGFYQGSSATRSCDASVPKDLTLTGLTDLVYAFVFFNTTTFAITPTDTADATLYKDVQALKKTKSALRTWIGVGGATYSSEMDAEDKYSAWSTMASTSANRAAFITSLGAFMKKYSFNGVNIDWEYPVYTNGTWEDTENLVSLVTEMHAAFGSTYEISVNIPATYSHLEYFDLLAMAPYVAWYNFMSYDLHSPTDSTGQIWPATNLTEISLYLETLWYAGVSPSQLLLGTAYYAHAYELANTTCNYPGCPSAGAGTEGICSESAGTLYNAELGKIISDYKLTPIYDSTAGVKWVQYETDQWAVFDDYQTLALKRAYASELCMGGISIWSVDQDDPLVDGLGIVGTGTVF